MSELMSDKDKISYWEEKCQSLESQLRAADELAKVMKDACETIHEEFCGTYEHELCKRYRDALAAYEKQRDLTNKF